MDATKQIITELETMKQGDLIRGEKFSALAYAKAIKGIKGLGKPITSVDDIKGIPGIGTKIQAKIQEIIETGSLASAARTKQELKLDIYDALLKVHGIGPVKARDLVNNHGIQSIADLRAHQDLLNEVQKTGLKYYEDILERIPRTEMLKHNRFLVTSLPPKTRGIVVGSFRRLAETSGDIDMLITFEEDVKPSQQKKMFSDYVETLKRTGYILDILALGPKKCMAVVSLGPGEKSRRLDLLITPHEEYAYSILYFTGSDTFNVAFRKHALSKGYTLNEHTLTPTGTAPPPPYMPSEESIFVFLGLKYVEPQFRKGEENIVPL
jgi:DNA polymerase/3'-5' exonuclease PolX